MDIPNCLSSRQLDCQKPPSRQLGRLKFYPCIPLLMSVFWYFHMLGYFWYSRSTNQSHSPTWGLFRLFADAEDHIPHVQDHSIPRRDRMKMSRKGLEVTKVKKVTSWSSIMTIPEDEVLLGENRTNHYFDW